MPYEFCFFTNVTNNVNLYQPLNYAVDIIKDRLAQAVFLRGKHQLIIIRREDERHKRAFVIYNYVYGTSHDSFGLCFVFNDKYPEDIHYIFSFCHDVISDIVKEGKILYIDNSGNIQISHNVASLQSAVVKQHIDKVNSSFDINKAKLSPLSQLPNYYKISQNQTVVQQLPETSWSMTESLNYNHIIVVTEEIEHENINKYRNVVKTLSEEKKKLFYELERQKEIYSKLQKEKKNYKYVVVLLVLLLISSICVFVIYGSKKKEKQQYVQKEKVMTDSIVNIQDDLGKATLQFDSLQQCYKSLQNSYNNLESKLKDALSSKSYLEERIKKINTEIEKRQPFAVTDMTYNKKTGILSVSYYGFCADTYTITIKALYDNSSYNCGSHNVKIEKGFHDCSFQIGKRRSNKFILMKGKAVIGGDLN